MQALAEGDCSKLEKVETDLEKIKSDISSACKNPLLRRSAEKLIEGRDVCAEVDNPNNEIEMGLREKKAECLKNNLL